MRMSPLLPGDMRQVALCFSGLDPNSDILWRAMNYDRRLRMTTRFEFRIERSFDALPGRVFDALVDPAEQLLWWGGAGDIVRASCDLSVGGTATILWGKGDDALIRADQVFREIERPSRLVYDETVTQAGSPVYECRLTFEFTRVADTTHVTLHHVGFPTAEERDMHERGTGIFFDRLTRYVSKPNSSA